MMVRIVGVKTVKTAKLVCFLSPTTTTLIINDIIVGKQMQSLGRRSARVSTVVDDCGANIYNAVWRSVLDELDIVRNHRLFVLCRLTSCSCLKVVSLREQIDMRVILDAEYRLAVSQVISKLNKNSF